MLFLLQDFRDYAGFLFRKSIITYCFYLCITLNDRKQMRPRGVAMLVQTLGAWDLDFCAGCSTRALFIRFREILAQRKIVCMLAIRITGKSLVASWNVIK